MDVGAELIMEALISINLGQCTCGKTLEELRVFCSVIAVVESTRSRPFISVPSGIMVPNCHSFEG
jgi:hypothetical protein